VTAEEPIVARGMCSNDSVIYVWRFRANFISFRFFQLDSLDLFRVIADKRGAILKPTNRTLFPVADLIYPPGEPSFYQVTLVTQPFD
jgi:hypothetical protein